MTAQPSTIVQRVWNYRSSLRDDGMYNIDTADMIRRPPFAQPVDGVLLRAEGGSGYLEGTCAHAR